MTDDYLFLFTACFFLAHFFNGFLFWRGVGIPPEPPFFHSDISRMILNGRFQVVHSIRAPFVKLIDPVAAFVIGEPQPFTIQFHPEFPDAEIIGWGKQDP
jgi:hypothetical protein